MEIAYFTHAEDGNTEILMREIAGQLNLPTNRIMPKKTISDKLRSIGGTC